MPITPNIDEAISETRISKFSDSKNEIHYLIGHVINIEPQVSMPIMELSSSIDKRINQHIILRNERNAKNLHKKCPQKSPKTTFTNKKSTHKVAKQN